MLIYGLINRILIKFNIISEIMMEEIVFIRDCLNIEYASKVGINRFIKILKGVGIKHVLSKPTKYILKV